MLYLIQATDPKSLFSRKDYHHEPPSVADLAARFRGEDEEIYRYLMFGNLYDMLADYFESDYLRTAFAGHAYNS